MSETEIHPFPTGPEPKPTTMLERLDRGYYPWLLECRALMLRKSAKELDWFSSEEAERMIRSALSEGDDQTTYSLNVNGEGDANRYTYDVALCRADDGWHQYDTKNDAWYFGIWYHPERRITVTFAEGDETVTVYHTEEAWRVALQAMADFYGDPPPAMVSYDANGVRTAYYDKNARPDLS